MTHSSLIMITIYSKSVGGSKGVLPVVFEDQLFIIDGWYQMYLKSFRQFTGTVQLEADYMFKDGLSDWSAQQLRTHAQKNNNIHIDPACINEMKKILKRLESL